MTPPDSLLYEYSVIRYVPRVDREEFLNIGLLMMCKRQKWIQGKISINAGKLSAFDKTLDINLLKHQAGMFENTDLPSEELPVEEKYRWLSAVKSAVLQTSPSHPGIIIRTNSDLPAIPQLEEEFKRLFHELVE